jgi:hypothetical protein
MTQLHSLKISRTLITKNQQLLSKLAPIVLPALKSLEITSKGLEPLHVLWRMPIVNYLHMASISMNDLDDNDVAALFTLIDTLPPDWFSHSLLHILRPLPLRSLTLQRGSKVGVEHPNSLQYIGGICPVLQYFSLLLSSTIPACWKCLPVFRTFTTSLLLFLQSHLLYLLSLQ